MIFGEIASALVIAGALWLVVRPHLASESGELLPTDTDSLQLIRERCIQVIRDLELDFQTGKITSSDYDLTREKLEIELSRVLESMELRR